MAEVITWGTSLERRFHGALVIVVLHMRRVAQSVDLDECFAAVLEHKMLDEDDFAFIRRCIALDERFVAKEAIEAEIGEDTVRQLQACALRLNSADPA